MQKVLLIIATRGIDYLNTYTARLISAACARMLWGIKQVYGNLG